MYIPTSNSLAVVKKLLFSTEQGILIEKLTIPSLAIDITYAFVDGEWKLSQPTPGASNSGSSLTELDPPVFSKSTGIYDGTIAITLTNSNTDSKIEYYFNNLDEVLVSDNGIQELVLGSTTMICARTTSPGQGPSEIVCNTYIIDGDHQLPVLSILVNEHDIFDSEVGLFELGPDAEDNYPFYGANFWSERSEEVYFQYFNHGSQDFTGHADLEMHGGRQARTHPQKTFKLLAKTKYKQPFFEYKFFKDKPHIESYKRLVVRNASGDYNVGHCRDGFLQQRMIDLQMNLDANAYQPIAVYINGSYYGMMGLREKIDKYNMLSNYGTTDIDLLEEELEILEGDDITFRKHLQYLLDHDMTDDEVYTEASTYFDPEHLVDYFLAEMSHSNTDWPLNNIKFWRTRNDTAKWRYLLFDLDAALGRFSWTRPSKDMLENKLDIPPADRGIYLTVMHAFLENTEFRYLLFNRHQDLFNTAFSTEEMHRAFDLFIDGVMGEMRSHIDRWPSITYAKWKDENLVKMKDYMTDRPSFSMDHFVNYFDLDGLYTLRITSSTENFSFDLNSLASLENSFDGKYFKNIPISVTSFEIEGRTFLYWQVDELESGKSYTIPDRIIMRSFDQDVTLEAVYNQENSDDLLIKYVIQPEEILLVANAMSTDDIEYSISDFSGRLIYDGTVKQPSPGVVDIKVPFQYEEGIIYIIYMKQGDRKSTIKIMTI